MPYIYINPVVRDGGTEGDPWAAFVGSPTAAQDQLVKNDAPAVTTPRPPVPSTPKVIGDREAEDLGLYETAKPQGDPWAAFISSPQQAPQAAPQTASFDQRFVEAEQRPDMQSALAERALQMTRGPATSPLQNMVITENNVLSAAEQGTSPNISEYGGRLVSNKVEQTDTGQIGYRDPQSGAFKLYDPKTQVYLTDPADNTVKIFSRGEGGADENPVVGASRVLTPGLAAGAPTARAAGTVLQRSIKPGMVNSTDVLKTAEPLYKEFDRVAAVIPIENHTEIVNRVRAAAQNAGQSETLAKPVYDVIDEIAGKKTIADLRDLREALGGFAKNSNSRIRAAARAAANEIKSVIVESLPPRTAAALNKADAITASGKSLEKVNQFESVAKSRAGAKTFGQSANEILRGFLGKIIEKMEATRPAGFRGKFMGFTPDELSAMREISQGRNVAERGARYAAALAPQKGILRAAVESGAALHTGGATVAIPVLGTAGDVLTRVLDAKQLARLKDLIAKRSPDYSGAVKNAVERYQKAQAELSNDPSPNKFAAYVAASRQLASGLTRDGIQVTSGSLIKALPAPTKADEENDQPSLPQ